MCVRKRRDGANNGKGKRKVSVRLLIDGEDVKRPVSVISRGIRKVMSTGPLIIFRLS